MYIYCIICCINRHTHTSHIHYPNIHSSLSKSHNVCATTDPIISAPLAFPTGLVSLSVRADFLLLCLLHPPPFFLLFLLFNSYLSNWVKITAHEQQKWFKLKSTKVSGRHVSKTQARQPTEPAGCPLPADFSQSCIIWGRDVRLQPYLSWPHGEQLWF